MVATDHWARIPGQDRAVVQLQRAASRPVHAYLLVGPRGSGVEEAARCFAAALITTDTDERSWDLVLRGVHPDVVEIDPPATQIRIEDAQAVVEEVSRSPIEGERKVVMLFDAERLRLNEAAANKLLKTLEEPPPRAVIILVTSGADQLLPTIRSRCQRVDFAYLGADAVAAALVADGIPTERADLLARLAGGRIDRAHALNGRIGPVRDAFVTAAASLDGTGGAVAVQAERVQDALQTALSGLETAQAEETEQLGARARGRGLPRAHASRTTPTARRASQARTSPGADRRAHRRHHGARDRLPRHAGRLSRRAAEHRSRGPGREPRAASAALDACRDARQAIAEFNPNETLLVERLFLHLPAAGGG